MKAEEDEERLPSVWRSPLLYGRIRLFFSFATFLVVANIHSAANAGAIFSRIGTDNSPTRTVRRVSYSEDRESSGEQIVRRLTNNPGEPGSLLAPTTKLPPKRPSIVLFGDSLTQRGFGEDGTVGWASLLASAYTRRADVKNRGFGGYNTHHALHVWPNVQDAFDDNILFATVFFGANDAALPGSPQHIPLEEFRQNLQEIVSNIRARLQLSQPDRAGSIPIFLFSPPPVDEEAWANHKAQSTSHNDKSLSNRQNMVTRKYGDIVKEVSQNNTNCPLVDTWGMLEGTNPDEYPNYLSDGVHLNEAGNRLIYDGFMKIIHDNFPALAPKTEDHEEGLPFEEKAWQEYD